MKSNKKRNIKYNKTLTNYVSLTLSSPPVELLRFHALRITTQPLPPFSPLFPSFRFYFSHENHQGNTQRGFRGLGGLGGWCHKNPGPVIGAISLSGKDSSLILSPACSLSSSSSTTYNCKKKAQKVPPFGPHSQPPFHYLSTRSLSVFLSLSCLITRSPPKKEKEDMCHCSPHHLEGPKTCSRRLSKRENKKEI